MPPPGCHREAAVPCWFDPRAHHRGLGLCRCAHAAIPPWGVSGGSFGAAPGSPGRPPRKTNSALGSSSPNELLSLSFAPFLGRACMHGGRPQFRPRVQLRLSSIHVGPGGRNAAMVVRPTGSGPIHPDQTTINIWAAVGKSKRSPRSSTSSAWGNRRQLPDHDARSGVR